MTAEEYSARARATAKRWADDWVCFATEALGSRLDREQKEILRSVQHNPRTSVSSGTARGKDYISAVAAVCFMYLTPKWGKDMTLLHNTKVALTAPTGRQVQNIMMPEVSRLFRSAQSKGIVLPGRLTASGIRTKYDEWFLTGFKADEHNHEAWTGFHAVNTMFVVTEATGISDNIFDAIEGNLQGNSRLLIVFNPNVSVGYAARSLKDTRFNSFRLNSLTAPNVVEKRTIISGQVDYEWVLDKVKSWCIPIDQSEAIIEKDDFEFEEQWYRPNDVFRVKVLGKLPEVSEDSLIPEVWIEMAEERWREHQAEKRVDLNKKQLRLGVDIAGMGRDNSVLCYRYDDFIDKFTKYNSKGEADHMKVSGMIVNEYNQNENSIALIDTIGEGAGVYSRLVELGYDGRTYSCKYSESARDRFGDPLKDVLGVYEFANMRAYLFWCVRDWLDPSKGSKAMLPPNDLLKQEATEIKWKFQSNGSIIIESKDDIKKRLGRSTDEFDALANTFYPAYFSVPQTNLSSIF